MAQNLSNFDSVLKEFYEGAIRDTLNSEVPLLRILEQSDKQWTGRRVIWPVRTTRNTGVGARGEATSLPTAGQQGYVQSIVSAVYNYGRITLTGQVMAAGKNAFAEALASELDGIMMDLKNDIGRQTWGDGTGRLAQVGASSVTGTNSAISVFNKFQRTGQPGARYIYQGQLLDFGTTTSHSADNAGLTVVSVSVAQTSAATVDTITVSSSAVAVSASSVFAFNASIPNGLGCEMMGLGGLIDDFAVSNCWGSNGFAGSSVQGINRATVSQWNAIVLHNNGTERSATSSLLQQAFDRIHEESGKEADMIMGHHEVVRAVYNELSNDRRFVAGAGGTQYKEQGTLLNFNGTPIERDRQAPYNSLFIFKKDAIKLYTLKDFEFADDDGAILSRVANQDSYEAYIRHYSNIGLDTTPKSCCVIRDIR